MYIGYLNIARLNYILNFTPFFSIFHLVIWYCNIKLLADIVTMFTYSKTDNNTKLGPANWYRL